VDLEHGRDVCFDGPVEFPNSKIPRPVVFPDRSGTQQRPVATLGCAAMLWTIYRYDTSEEFRIQSEAEGKIHRVDPKFAS
jgi:hypothetical protein